MEASSADAAGAKGPARPKASKKPRKGAVPSERSATAVKESEGKKKPRGPATKSHRKKSKACAPLAVGESEKPTDPKNVCKPLSVYLTRLPAKTASENAASSASTSAKKIRRLARWKNGIFQKRKKDGRSRVEAQANPPASRVADDDAPGKATVSGPESVSIRLEPANGDLDAFPRQQIDEIEPVAEGIESGTTIPEGTDTGAECARVLEVEATTPSPDTSQDTNLSQERATRDASESTALVARDHSPGTAARAEGVSTGNGEDFSQQTEGATNGAETNRRISRQAAKRRRLSESEESNERHTSAGRSKKLRCSTSLGHAEGTSAMEASDATPERQNSLRTLRAGPKFIRDRRKAEIHLPKEAVVFVTRLDYLRSPLIKKWAKRVASLRYLEATDERSSDEDNVEDGNPDARTVGNSFERVDERPTRVTAQPEDGEHDAPSGIVMCDSNEDDSDGDDDEIMAFLSARCRARQLNGSTHSADDSDDQAYRRVRLSRNSTSDASLIQSGYDSRSDVQPSEGQMSRQSAVSSSRCTEFGETDSLHPDADLEDESSHEESAMAPPLTRSRSRAALENFNFDGPLNLTEVSRELCKQDFLFRVSSHNCDDSGDTLTNEETNNETRVADSCPAKARDVVEREPNEANDASPVAATVVSASCPVDAIRLARDDRNEDRAARKALAAMKNAMVVLTRLEDLDALAESDEIGSRAGYELEYSGDFCQETLKDDVDSNYDIDLQSEEMRLSCRSADPLEIDRVLVEQSDISATGEDIVGDPEDESSRGSGLADDGVSRGQSESEDEGELTVDEGASHETAESDVELTLVFDEADVSNQSTGRAETAPTDASGKALASGISDLSGGSPGLKSPEESRRHNRRLKCQNTSSAHKCPTCNSLFNDSELLEQHRLSSVHCNADSACPVSPTTFKTLAKSTKQRLAEEGLRKGSSGEQSTNDETTSSPGTAPIAESTSTKDKKQKQTVQKNPAKKLRSRPRCRVDNLTCNVCSTSFDTKTALSEHLYKHSSVELQEAFRIAKAKAMATAQAENATRKKKAKKKNLEGGEASDDAIIEVSGDDDPARDFDDSPTGASIVGADDASSATIGSSTSSLATVCLCHRDNDQAPLGNTDLQIEMVLLCKYCHVLFRRRECLEIHYRTSLHCATDRTRERWPRLFCANCQLTLNNWADMRQHLEIHARQNAECAIRFVCNICRVVFVGFGTLFYNHWVSHSKYSMFVAGRYNFPKFSVQTIDGTEKLPAGAGPDENYIFVAEHVCTACKKPFSMRRDLETHQRAQCYRKLQQQRKSISPLWCDVCCMLFESEGAINDHAASEHGDRCVYATAGIPNGAKPFKCTACATFASSIGAIDEHWKSSRHERPAAAIASDSTNDARTTSESIVAEHVPVTSSLDGEPLPDQTSSGAATLTDENRTTESPLLIIIGEDDAVQNDRSQASVRTAKRRTVPANRKSVISVTSNTSPESNVASDIEQLPILRGALIKPSSATARHAAEKQTAKTRALEDPCVNVVFSDTCGTNLLASLVLNDAQEKTKNVALVGSTESYQILMTDHSTMGSITNVRNSTSIEEPEISVSSATPPSSDRAEKDKTTTANSPDPTASLSGQSISVKTPQKSTLKRTSGGSSGQPTERRFTVPEVIDIVDDDAEVNPGKPTSHKSPTVHQDSVDSTLNKRNGRSLRDVRKSNVGQSQAAGNSPTLDKTAPQPSGGKGKSPEQRSSSETSSVAGRNVSVTSGRSRINAAASQASKTSYEEERWNWLRTESASPSAGGSIGTKKQGFLRVKDLSELQAVRTHACSACDASFQSETELSEHQRLHVGSDSLPRTAVRYPTGMSAALATPEAPELSKSTGQSGVAYTSENASWTIMGTSASDQVRPYVPQGVLSSLAGQQNPPTSRLPDTAVAEDPLGPWVLVGQNPPVAPASCALIAQPGFATPMVPNSQATLTVLPSAEAINTMIGTSSSQIQDNSSGQQLLVSSVSSCQVPDTSQRLADNRTATLGYHVLPPMVVVPSGQSAKTTTTVANQRTASSNYLPGFRLNNSPLTYQPGKRNKFRCNICHSFECDNIDAFNYHVTKHYTGWRNTHGVTRHSLEPSPVAMIAATTVAIPTIASLEMRTETTQQVPPKTTDPSNSVVLNNWTVKDTPQGPVLVTPVSGSTDPRALTSFAENNNRSILRQTPVNSNNPNTNNNYSGQIVLRCMICKSALYKNYPPLRNHVILVHGVTDFSLLGLDNIAQKSYHCTQCPNTTALFDCEKKYREHVDTIHTHACPSCRRVFSNFLTLRHHLEQCRVSSSNDRNTYGNNCR